MEHCTIGDQRPPLLCDSYLRDCCSIILLASFPQFTTSKCFYPGPPADHILSATRPRSLLSRLFWISEPRSAVWSHSSSCYCLGSPSFGHLHVCRQVSPISCCVVSVLDLKHAIFAIRSRPSSFRCLGRVDLRASPTPRPLITPTQSRKEATPSA